VDDSHPARSNLEAYRRERTAMVEAACASVQASDEGHVRRADRDVVLDTIVGPLADIAAQAFSAIRPLRPSIGESASSDGDVLEECRAAVRLFNEHYVVKPGSTGVEFGWHTDENEQLSMCMNRPDLPYVSLWIPLCDTTEANGTLELLPRGQPQPPTGANKLHPFFTKLASEVEEPPCEEEEVYSQSGSPKESKEAEVGGGSSSADAGAPICRKVRVRAGGAVLFSSDVWHRSGPNRSDAPRPVFYAQYTCGVLRSDGSLGAQHGLREGKDAGAHKSRRLAGPLAFAVPCRGGLFAGGAQRMEREQK
jgi:hypothetical protein